MNTLQGPTPPGIYTDGTQYSRWFADGTANDLSGKISLTSTVSGVWSDNSGPFPNTASVLDPYYVYAPATLPSPSPIDLRDRSFTVSWWMKRACSSAVACAIDTSLRAAVVWEQVFPGECGDVQKFNMVFYFYMNSANFGRPCLNLVSSSDDKVVVTNQWVHYAVTVDNKGSAAADNFTIYYNGAVLATDTANEAPSVSSWKQITRFSLGSSSPATGSFYDFRFWYSLALDQANIKRQMCFNGYYWEADATANGKCVACPAGTFSGLAGAAGMSECLACSAGYTSKAGSSSCVSCFQCPANMHLL